MHYKCTLFLNFDLPKSLLKRGLDYSATSSVASSVAVSTSAGASA